MLAVCIILKIPPAKYFVGGILNMMHTVYAYVECYSLFFSLGRLYQFVQLFQILCYVFVGDGVVLQVAVEVLLVAWHIYESVS